MGDLRRGSIRKFRQTVTAETLRIKVLDLKLNWRETRDWFEYGLVDHVERGFRSRYLEHIHPVLFRRAKNE